MEPRRPPPPFDLVILTGFLGAGKTTLLNSLLRDPELADTLVLINEFGAVGLDHLLVESVEGDMLVLTSGCLCCSIRGDLVAALEDALKARDNGRMRPFARVVIETTGLADPAPVLHTIMSHPYLRLRFRLRAVATLVDATVGAATLDAYPEAVKQVALADRLVLTKTDLVADEASLRSRLAALNRAAPVYAAARGEATVERLFGGLPYEPTALGGEAAAWLAAEAHDPGADRQGHQDHGHQDHRNQDHRNQDHRHRGRADHDHARHDVNRHSERIRAAVVRWTRPVAPMAVSLFLELLRSTYGAQVLRLKGLVALADDPGRPLVVHAVQHMVHPPARLDAWPDADRTTRLVVICDGLDPAFVEGLWTAAAGEARIDSADLATQAQNPLAPRAGGLLA